jgi:hypothetical protein
MCSDPVDAAYRPDIIVVRAGAHTGALEQACVYLIPRPARASSVGVVAYVSP